MNRKQYEEARRLYRDNGHAALRWMSPDVRDVMTRLEYQPEDPLGYRALVLPRWRATGRPGDAIRLTSWLPPRARP